MGSKHETMQPNKRQLWHPTITVKSNWNFCLYNPQLAPPMPFKKTLLIDVKKMHYHSLAHAFEHSFVVSIRLA